MMPEALAVEEDKAGSDEQVVEESTIGQVEIGVAKGSFDKIKIGEENCL